ncbi:MAG: hypothetical protein QGH60_19505 [Phycisphaerae bacterium]|nr:hypothetical protein [Phycisphaerae bacterium]
MLNLGCNALTILPTEIGKLTDLTWLSLSSNSLTILPPEIGKLTDLKVLIVYKTPLEEPPLSVAERGIDAIRDYFEQLNA